MAQNVICPKLLSLHVKSLQRTFSLKRYQRLHGAAFDQSNEKTHDFGFEKVTQQEKAGKVYNVFENVADKYDVMNDAMSLGVHRLWKDFFIQRLKPSAETKLLDVAGGTGDIAYRFLNYLKVKRQLEGRKRYDQSDEHVEADDSRGSKVTVCEINEAMIKQGRQRSEQLGYTTKDIAWVQGDAQNLPFDNNTFDAYSIAFGIRNVVNIDKCLSEAYRVLRRGGRFLCLEFSHVETPPVRWLYDNYSFQVIPVLGQLIAGDWASYQYLVESIRKFPKQEEFRILIEKAGFKLVQYENLSCGIVSIHSGFKL